LGFGVSADSFCADEAEKAYSAAGSPKRNKKIVRIVTVLGYIFSVSTGCSFTTSLLFIKVCLHE
jgi:hypothetical protein